MVGYMIMVVENPFVQDLRFKLTRMKLKVIVTKGSQFLKMLWLKFNKVWQLSSPIALYDILNVARFCKRCNACGTNAGQDVAPIVWSIDSGYFRAIRPMNRLAITAPTEVALSPGFSR